MDPTLAEILDEFDDTDAPEGMDVGREIENHEEGREPFRLIEPEHFDWAARKLARAEAECARLADWKAAEIHKLEAAFDRRIEQARRDVSFFDAMIRHGVMELEPDTKGKRAIKTPHLTASVARRESWEWPDDETLAAWAEARGAEYVRRTVKPDKTALKAYIKDTGDAPEALEISTVESVRLEVLA